MAINKRPEKRTGSNQGIFTNLVQKSRMGNTYSQSAKGNAITWHGRTSVSPVCLSPESLLWEWPPINQNCPHLYDPSCMARLEQWKLFAQRLRLTSPNYALTNADHTFIFNTVWITNQESGHEEMLSKRTSSLKWKIPPPHPILPQLSVYHSRGTVEQSTVPPALVSHAGMLFCLVHRGLSGAGTR